MLYQIKYINARIHKYGTLWTTKSMSCCLKIGHRGIQKGEIIFDLAQHDNRLFENSSEEAYQSAATVTALVGWNLAVWEFPFSAQQ